MLRFFLRKHNRIERAALVTLRLALVSDIPKIMSLQQQAESAAQWTAREYERMLNEKSGVVLVAEMGDKVCGFVAGAGIGAEWELENIVIESSARRKGTGRRLVQSFLDHAKHEGGTRVFLQVREDNTAARGLYECAEFRVNGRRPGYYGSTDAVLYVCDLT